MTLNKLLLLIAPVGLMIAVCLGLTGSESWLARFGNSSEAQLTLGRIGRLALKAGLGEIEIDDAKLVEAFEDLAKRFRGGGAETRKSPLTQNQAGASTGANSET